MSKPKVFRRGRDIPRKLVSFKLSTEIAEKCAELRRSHGVNWSAVVEGELAKIILFFDPSVGFASDMEKT